MISKIVDVTPSRQRKMLARPSDTVAIIALEKTSRIKSNTDLRQIWNAILDRVKLQVSGRHIWHM